MQGYIAWSMALVAPKMCESPVLKGFAGRFAPELAALIDQEAEHQVLDPLDVAAIIILESGGDPEAVNEKSGATGLMQVMPSDNPKGLTIFRGRPTIEELKRPATNLRWGCGIFKLLLVRFTTTEAALYHYSGGTAWPSYDRYAAVYWSQFLKYRNALEELVERDIKESGV